jgi:hypothetical protein
MGRGKNRPAAAILNGCDGQETTGRNKSLTARQSGSINRGAARLEFHLVRPIRSEIMPSNGDGVTSSLRKVLAESHVSAVAVAVLLLISFGSLFHALLALLPWIIDFLLTAIAVHGLPSVSFTVADRLILTAPLAGLFKAFAGFIAACLLARWGHRVGLFRCLATLRAALPRRNRA